MIKLNTFNQTTTTDKNATQIIDPNLIPNFNPGLYKIVKEREDGTEEEIIIQKGNN